MSFASSRRSRCVSPMIEGLENRQLLAGVQFNLTFNDPDGQFAAHPLLVENLNAVAQILGQHFEGKGSIEIEITPNRDYTGGPAMAPSGVQFVSSDGYFTTVEYNTVYEARTGVDPNGSEPDIRMVLDPGYYLDNVAFLDPSGAARTAAMPADKQDFISGMLRSMVRVMGMSGYQFTTSGAYGFGWGYYIYTWSDGSHLRTTYDKLRGSLSTFDGPNATAVYGGPVPTTLFGPGGSTQGHSDFYFLGMPGSDLENDLMNGMGLKVGQRYDLSAVDIGILKDIGWAERAAPPLVHCDLNHDGIVSIADFITMASNFGKTNATYDDGDVNSDGQVSIGDFIELMSHFNTSSASVTAAPQAPAAMEITATPLPSERTAHKRKPTHRQIHHRHRAPKHRLSALRTGTLRF